MDPWNVCVYVCIFTCILYQSGTLDATTNLIQSISDLVLNHQDFVLILPFWFVKNNLSAKNAHMNDIPMPFQPSSVLLL